jgi:mRNA interferase HigB
LSAWRKVAEHTDWSHFTSLKQTFGSADQVGNCVVFDVGNNRFRLIGRVNYARGIVYVLKAMDHVEYDKKRWVDDCGCHDPPPKRPATVRKPTPSGKPSHPEREKGS